MLLFWAIFWVLDGGDKFFDGQSEILFEKWSSKGTVLDAENNTVFTIQPPNVVGWYGVNYADQIESYFKTFHAPRPVALGFLYAFASLEIVTGLLFLSVFVWHFLPDSREEQDNLFSDRTVQRLAYKMSVLLFVILSVGFLMFGDRTRLWEVGTYMLMTLIGYDMWYRTDRYLLESRRGRTGNRESAVL
jgi:hypothetical protein